ncbi:MAG: D-tyrosyl-tRNA(Tyr) deacylase [Spirochaetales bacterium]|nr:D-tyrosyl-tRNA(Tyr) deacylase [Spirochaetales bacterium]
MRAVVQRCINASVKINNTLQGSIENGLVVYLGVGLADTEKDLAYITDKIVNLRVFEDPEGKMNLSLRESGGAVLLISQFTLFGDARRGRRPSYSNAAPPERAKQLYDRCAVLLRSFGVHVATGVFQAMMNVTATNVGPVTILLDSEKNF